MQLRTAILISAILHIAFYCGAANWFSWQPVVMEVSVNQGATVVVIAPSPPVESPVAVPVEPTPVSEVVEVSIEPAPELDIVSEPIRTQEAPSSREVAKTVKVAAPMVAAQAAKIEPVKTDRRDDITAAPLARKQAMIEHNLVSAKTAPNPLPRRAPSLPPRVKSEPILIAQRTPVPVHSSAQQGAIVDSLPRPWRNNPAPFYPRDALAAGIEGRVLLRILIEADGTVSRVQVSSSSGSASLDEAALTAVRAWRFDPALRSGRAVAFEVLKPVTFSIRRS